MSKRRVYVSDHALLRYLQRIGGFDIEGLRASIAKRIEGHIVSTPMTVVLDGYRFLVRDGDKGAVLVTVVDKEDCLVNRDMSHGRERRVK